MRQKSLKLTVTNLHFCEMNFTNTCRNVDCTYMDDNKVSITLFAGSRLRSPSVDVTAVAVHEGQAVTAAHTPHH